MISKIKDASTQVIQQYQKSELPKPEAARPAGNASSTVMEKVDLSSKAKDIQRIKQAIDEIPDIREGKVQDLKAQIDAGTYKVNTDKLAEKMVGESLIDIMA
jgi:negative regulator of flagellin synthesis FlgM